MIINLKEGNLVELLVGVSEKSKFESLEKMHEIVSWVTHGGLDIGVIINYNGDVLQFFGRDNLFFLEHVNKCVNEEEIALRNIKKVEFDYNTNKVMHFYVNYTDYEANLDQLVDRKTLISVLEFFINEYNPKIFFSEIKRKYNLTYTQKAFRGEECE